MVEAEDIKAARERLVSSLPAGAFAGLQATVDWAIKTLPHIEKDRLREEWRRIKCFRETIADGDANVQAVIDELLTGSFAAGLLCGRANKLAEKIQATTAVIEAQNTRSSEGGKTSGAKRREQRYWVDGATKLAEDICATN